MGLASCRDLERVTIRVLHHLHDVLDGTGSEHRRRNFMIEIAFVDRHRLPGFFIQQRLSVERGNLLERARLRLGPRHPRATPRIESDHSETAADGRPPTKPPPAPCNTHSPS